MEEIKIVGEDLSLSSLTAVSPIDGRYESNSKPLREYFSEYALIKYRVIVEIKWFEQLFAEKIVGEWSDIEPTITEMQKIYENFSTTDAERVKEIEKTTNHDVKAVEYFLKEKFDLIPQLKDLKEFLHFTCTSEDINNLAYGMMIDRALRKVLITKLKELQLLLNDSFAIKFAGCGMMSRTHGQSATPTTIGKEIANFVYRIE